MSAKYTEAAVLVSCQVSWFKLKERDWKVRSTKVDAGDFKHELLNPLRSTMAVNVLTELKFGHSGPKTSGILCDLSMFYCWWHKISIKLLALVKWNGVRLLG